MSGSSINTVKWTGLVALALLALCAIALVHSGNRITARVAMGVFAAAVAVVITISRHRMSRSRGSSVLILTR